MILNALMALSVPAAMSFVFRTAASGTTVPESRPSVTSPNRVKAQAEKEVALCVCRVVLTPGLPAEVNGLLVCVCVYNVRVMGMYYVVARLGQTQNIRFVEPIPSPKNWFNIQTCGL